MTEQGPKLTATERAAVEEWLRSEEAERRLAEAIAKGTHGGCCWEPTEDARAILAALRGER